MTCLGKYDQLTRTDNGISYTQSWDKENRLSVVTNTTANPDIITTFFYNGDGARVKKTEQVNTTITTTFYAGAIEVLSTTQVITKTYYSAGGQMIAMREVTNTTGAGTLTYLHSDHLGSTSTTTCGNSACGALGAVLTRQSYYPYGTVRQAGNLPTDHTFTGQLEDDSTGLMFYNARYYSGALGRFISADTIVPGAGNPQGLNRYNYTQNNPINRTDPTGHCDGTPGGLSCMDSYDAVWHLKNSALSVSQNVSNGTIKPVEGLAQIADEAYALYPRDPNGFMAAMTNVLVGVDPNKTSVTASVRAGEDPLDNPYYARHDLLAYNAPVGTHYTDAGDWSSQYVDGTSNQAYHFWGFVAIDYYEGDIMANIANMGHDPSLLDEIVMGITGRNIDSYGGTNVPILNTLANHGTDAEVSSGDFYLGLAGISLSNDIVENYVTWQNSNSPKGFHPGTWIRQNLKAD